LGRSDWKPVAALQGLSSSSVISPSSRTADRTLMRLRRLSECREREVARYWFAQPACRSATSRHSRPLRARGVDVHLRRPTHAPLRDLRAPTGHLPRSNRWRGIGSTSFRWASYQPEANSPSWALVPYSACGAGDPLLAGLPHPPRSGLSVSHAPAGLRPPAPSQAYFIPVTLLGFGLQGFLPLGDPHLSRGRSSHAVGNAPYP